MRIKKFLNIRNIMIKKRILILFLVVFIPLVVMSFVLYNNTENVVANEIKEELKTDTAFIASTLNAKIHSYKTIVSQIITNNQIIKLLTKSNYNQISEYAFDLKRYVLEYTSSFEAYDPLITGFHIYQENNTTECGNSLLNTNRIEHNNWYEDLYQYNSIKCIYQKEPIDKIELTEKHNLLVASAFPVYYMKDVKSIVLIQIDANTMIEDMLSNSSYEKGLLLITNDNTVIYDKPLSTYNLLNEYNGNFQRIQQSYKINSDDIILVSTWCDELNANVIMYMHKATKNQTDVIAIATGIIISITFIMLIFVYYVFYSTICIPLDRLKRDIEMIEGGHLQLKIYEKEQDEIGQMHHQLGKMLNQINVLLLKQEKISDEKKTAELIALRSQINPHFLYNSLSTISWKAHFAGENDIYKLSLKLASFYRQVLNVNDRFNDIEKEIDNIKNYVTIQQMVYDNNFISKFDIDPSIYKHKIQTFLLQPIVENAILHGLNVRSDKNGILSFTAYKKDNCFKFIIEDNGIGMTKEEIDKLLTKQDDSYGVSSVNKRIKLYYGDEYGIEFEIPDTEGTRAIIIIPIND